MLLVVVVLGGWEVLWRARGFRPRVESVDESWVLAFNRLQSGGTVVAGTSRIQAALDPDAFRRAFPGARPVNLSLPGNSPLPVLEYLADSTDFHGLLLAEILPLFVFDATLRSEVRGREVIARYRRERVSPAAMWEDWLRVHALQHVVFRAPALLPGRFVRELREGRLPVPGNAALRPDRFGPVYQRALTATRPWDPVTGFHGLEYGIAERTGRPANQSEYDALVARIEHSVNRILDRGGRVVLLYLPACGPRRAIEERRYPRATYWDPLARETRAVAIAAEDFPELVSFDCFDGSHLDQGDAPRFASALGKELARRFSASGTPNDPTP
ncbi:MAG: hypothetical protein IT359_14585 [Gemmatimonadaceae bacterium]|nr:hypothetical protein [Gemmatimonadaceae bacterium]